MRIGACSLAAAFLMLSAQVSRAQSSLLYLEAQAVGGYSSATDEAIYCSMDPKDPMQKPSVGIDWVSRLSNERRDYAVVGLQVRLAYNHELDNELEFQLYNAWFRYKAGFADLWIGHDRPALGLSSYLDNHGLLLPNLAMMGWGFDRDWGVGFSRDFDWGNLSGSLTTGSGMPIYFKGNYLASARISKGVLARDNYNLGFSASWGDILETMGYDLMSDEPLSFHMVGIDCTYLRTRFESRVDLMVGERENELADALMWRFTVNFLEENRLKIEAQPTVWELTEDWSYNLSAGVSYQATAALALRAMYQYINVPGEEAGPIMPLPTILSAASSADQTGGAAEDNRIVFQVYYYKGM